MDVQSIYSMLRDITMALHATDKSAPTLPEHFEPGQTLVGMGLDIVYLPEILDELQSRLNGRDLKLHHIFKPETLNTLSIGKLIDLIRISLQASSRNPVIVYVDDEQENLFVFKRKFGKVLNLKTFEDPLAALEFILQNQDVTVVITDEVMPRMSGNELCDAVRKSKPNMKFILITGNPNNDGDLLHKSLRKNRFYEFINKPVDFEGKGEEFLAMIQGLSAFDW